MLRLHRHKIKKQGKLMKIIKSSPFYKRIYFKTYWHKPYIISQHNKRTIIRYPGLEARCRKLERKAPHRIEWDEQHQRYYCPACVTHGFVQRFDPERCTALKLYTSPQAYYAQNLASWSKLNEANLLPDGPPRGRANYKSKDIWYELYSRDECIPKPPTLLTESELRLLSDIAAGLKEQGFDIFESEANFRRFQFAIITATQDYTDDAPIELFLVKTLAEKL
jgi:hypothetical protein